MFGDEVQEFYGTRTDTEAFCLVAQSNQVVTDADGTVKTAKVVLFSQEHEHGVIARVKINDGFTTIRCRNGAIDIINGQESYKITNSGDIYAISRSSPTPVRLIRSGGMAGQSEFAGGDVNLIRVRIEDTELEGVSNPIASSALVKSIISAINSNPQIRIDAEENSHFKEFVDKMAELEGPSKGK